MQGHSLVSHDDCDDIVHVHEMMRYDILLFVMCCCFQDCDDDEEQMECMLTFVAQMDPKGWIWEALGYKRRLLRDVSGHHHHRHHLIIIIVIIIIIFTVTVIVVSIMVILMYMHIFDAVCISCSGYSRCR